MELYALCFILGLALLFEYKCFGAAVATPAINFTCGLFIASFFLLLYMHVWRVDIQWNTVILIVGSVFAMFLGSWYIYRTSKNGIIAISLKSDDNFHYIGTNRLIVFFLIQVFFGLIRAYFLMDYYGTSNLALALVTHTKEMKFAEEAAKLPFGLSFLCGMASNIGTVCAFLLPQYIYKENKSSKTVLWLWINFIAACVLSLLSSGRSPMLWILLSFFISLSIQIVKKEMKIKLKHILCFVMFIRILVLISSCGLFDRS